MSWDYSVCSDSQVVDNDWRLSNYTSQILNVINGLRIMQRQYLVPEIGVWSLIYSRNLKKSRNKMFCGNALLMPNTIYPCEKLSARKNPTIHHHPLSHYPLLLRISTDLSSQFAGHFHTICIYKKRLLINDLFWNTSRRQVAGQIVW